MIIAGGAGKNEVKIFENNIDYAGTFKNQCTLDLFDTPVLCLDTSKIGDNVAIGTGDGRVYVVNVKVDEELETYDGGPIRTFIDKKGTTHPGGDEEEEESKA